LTKFMRLYPEDSTCHSSDLLEIVFFISLCHEDGLDSLHIFLPILQF
jgi:hypothetical protein